MSKARITDIFEIKETSETKSLNILKKTPARLPKKEKGQLPKTIKKGLPKSYLSGYITGYLKTPKLKKRLTF